MLCTPEAFLSDKKGGMRLVSASKGKLARIVGRFGVYPAGLIRGDPKNVAQIFVAKEGMFNDNFGRMVFEYTGKVFSSRCRKGVGHGAQESAGDR
jgi:hypothetical protein